MGGRLDATSLCAGDISIITSISHDHTSYLGDNIEKIAFEKASIIKKVGTVFALKETEEVVCVINSVAEKKSAEIYLLGDQFWVEKTVYRPNSQSLTYSNNKGRIEDLELSLIGDFQIDNASLAISVNEKHDTNILFVKFSLEVSIY